MDYYVQKGVKFYKSSLALNANLLTIPQSELHVCFIFQNVLRELEQKKPQLDELVNTAENLKADSNKAQLHGKGKGHMFVCFLPIQFFLHPSKEQV